MPSLVLQSPAKLNLYLEVLNKRSDGFHNIVTLFERINLCDRITLKSTTSCRIQIHCNHPDVPLDSKNLVYKVARLLQEDFALTQGVEIRIEKRIPVAAGLAGGSSNAATVLMGLNQLWNLKLSQAKLLFYARKIGSDVAFFLYKTSWALGTQRGDKIKALKLKRKLWHVVIVPRIKMYSWKVYGGLKLRLTKRNDNVNILIHKLRKNNRTVLNRLLINDLEAVVIRFSPPILRLKEELKSFNTQGVMVSGSGPAVFAVAETKEDAKMIQKVFFKRFKQVFLAETL